VRWQIHRQRGVPVHTSLFTAAWTLSPRSPRGYSHDVPDWRSQAGHALAVVIVLLPALGMLMLVLLVPVPNSRAGAALGTSAQVGVAATPPSPGDPPGVSATPAPALSAASAPTATAAIPVPTPAPTSTPTSTGSVDAGTDMPLGGLPGWHQIFTEDFNTAVPVGSFPGTIYGSKWGAYPDGRHDTSGNGTYYPSRVLSVSHGVLNMYLHTEIVNGVAVHMVSAPVPHLPGGAQAYGRYSIRFRADSVPGYKTAWLLWPDSGLWPADGEIDFPEGNLDGTIYAFMHYANPAGGQDWFRTGATYAGWHIATIEWQPGKVTFILDGQLVGVSTTQVPFNPMNYVLQTETCLRCAAPSDSAAGNVQVDWVVIYSRA